MKHGNLYIQKNPTDWKNQAVGSTFILWYEKVSVRIQSQKPTVITPLLRQGFSL